MSNEISWENSFCGRYTGRQTDRVEVEVEGIRLRLRSAQERERKACCSTLRTAASFIKKAVLSSPFSPLFLSLPLIS